MRIPAHILLIMFLLQVTCTLNDDVGERYLACDEACGFAHQCGLLPSNLGANVEECTYYCATTNPDGDVRYGDLYGGNLGNLDNVLGCLSGDVDQWNTPCMSESGLDLRACSGARDCLWLSYGAGGAETKVTVVDDVEIKVTLVSELEYSGLSDYPSLLDVYAAFNPPLEQAFSKPECPVSAFCGGGACSTDSPSLCSQPTCNLSFASYDGCQELGVSGLTLGVSQQNNSATVTADVTCAAPQLIPSGEAFRAGAIRPFMTLRGQAPAELAEKICDYIGAVEGVPPDPDRPSHRRPRRRRAPPPCRRSPLSPRDRWGAWCRGSNRRLRRAEPPA